MRWWCWLTSLFLVLFPDWYGYPEKNLTKGRKRYGTTSSEAWWLFSFSCKHTSFSYRKIPKSLKNPSVNIVFSFPFLYPSVRVEDSKIHYGIRDGFNSNINACVYISSVILFYVETISICIIMMMHSKNSPCLRNIHILFTFQVIHAKH